MTWSAVAFWYCIIWSALLVVLMVFHDVRKADTVGFLVKGSELAFTVIIALVIAGVLQ